MSVFLLYSFFLLSLCHSFILLLVPSFCPRQYQCLFSSLYPSSNHFLFPLSSLSHFLISLIPFLFILFLPSFTSYILALFFYLFLSFLPRLFVYSVPLFNHFLFSSFFVLSFPPPLLDSFLVSFYFILLSVYSFVPFLLQPIISSFLYIPSSDISSSFSHLYLVLH